MLPTLDVSHDLFKIEIVGIKKKLVGAGRQPSTKSTTIRPYELRVRRSIGDGLWELEADNGQLYLAVLANPVHERRMKHEEERRATGEAYPRTKPQTRHLRSAS